MDSPTTSAGAKHVSCSTDDNYAQHCGVMLCSLLENNPGSRYVVHILINEATFSPDNSGRLRRLVERYGSECVFHDVDCAKIQGMPDRKVRPLGPAAYYRLLYASIFDESIHQVFYLDCDIIVNGPIDEIFGLELGDDYALAAVQDAECYSDEHRMEMPIPYERCMFCSGVMLVNLDYWRRHHVEDKLIAAGRKVRRRCLHDQDALNVVFHRKWFRLAPKWNKFNMSGGAAFLAPGDRDDYLHRPIIIHFLSSFKPWQDIPGMRYRELYYKYLALTEWRDFTPQRREGESVAGLRRMMRDINFSLWCDERGVHWLYKFYDRSVKCVKTVAKAPLKLFR